jgi:hypothetical protein
MGASYTRQELHDLIWSAPMRDVAKRLGLSDVGLRKNCVRGFVPPPPQNKVKAGHKPKIIPLPQRPPGVSDVVSFGRYNWGGLRQKLFSGAELEEPVFPEPIEVLRERVARNLEKVVAAKTLSPAHVAFRHQLEDDERKRLSGSLWDKPLFDSPVEQRRLRILQGLFYGLERVGCTAHVQTKDTRTISISVGDQSVYISLGPPATRQRGAAVPEEKALRFAILKGYQGAEMLFWQDNAEQRLESLLSTIAVEIVVAGERRYRDHLVWLYQDELRRREEERQAALKRRLEAEQSERERLAKLESDRLQRLIASADGLRRAESIRRFVAAVLENAPSEVDPVRVQQWRDWALLQADRLDPIKTGRIWNHIGDRQKIDSA